MDTLRVLNKLLMPVLTIVGLALSGGRVAARTNAQIADHFVEAIDRYVVTAQQETAQPRQGVVFRSLTPVVPEVARSRGRLMRAGAIARADRAFSAQVAAADAPSRPADPLTRILSDSQLESIELVAGNLETMAAPQVGDVQVRLCEESRAYCRPVRSSGWIQETEGLRRMQFDLPTGDDPAQRGTG